ncbi:MAG: outer membrane beta-barrel domain-containing protein [Alphaproteobacteria bacterium]|nr:outer membrane beta-barrel domain-containing protein [Alphaproteobacteria bacterium]MCB9696832.1 outer membrane beta-barrel domain-containing protein [Alphaproteobacteria bacterium]
MFPSLPPIHDTLRTLARAAVVVAGLVPFASSALADSPGLDAIEEFKGTKRAHPAVENRFFLKEGRFEFSPTIGYVPNNPYARRYTGGVQLGYHFGETISAQAQVFYSPDLGEGDVKGLVQILLDRAYNGNTEADDEFQQPLDKVGLGADFGLAWAPFYGKINLVGETVLNMDVYFYGGAGMVSKKNYIARYDEAGVAAGDNNMLLEPGANEVKVAPYVGIGQNYFLNRVMAFKIDLRAAFYVDNKPQYHVNDTVTEQRLYNNVIASGGLAFFFPNMKRRLYEF